MIKRYDYHGNHCVEMIEYNSGEYVTYEDHAAAPAVVLKNDLALENFRTAMEGIGHIRRTLEETFGGLHGTHVEPDILVECKSICDAICEAYRSSQPDVVLPPEMVPFDDTNPEHIAAAKNYNQALADAKALGCQPDKVVKFPGAGDDSLLSTWQFKDAVINALDAAGVKWVEGE